MLVGVVGKPNVGKSTFFSAVTLIPVAIASRPFTTTKPNRGIGYLRTDCVCKELGVKDEPVNSFCIDGVRMIPVEIIDCAGLVPGAWEGRGLGNQFLDDIRKADALIHIIDAAGSTDEEGQLCKPGTRDPLLDIEFLEFEFNMWLTEIVRKDWRRIIQTTEMMSENIVDLLSKRLTGLAIKREHILLSLRRSKLDHRRPSLWSLEELKELVSHLQKIAKPMLIAANKVDLPYSEKNIKRMRDKGFTVIPCSTEAELVLRRAAEKGLIEYKPGDIDYKIRAGASLNQAQETALKMIREKVLLGWGNTGVQQAINSAFMDLLGMIVVYPVEDVENLCDHDGRVLPGAYLVPRGTTTRDLAYKIHTDLGDGFIYAIDAKNKRRLGEDYVLKDRDVIKIVSAKGRP
jgi:ribosome-binding ATPase YchF (GTP1/OBG family)